MVIAVFGSVSWVKGLIPDLHNPFAERTVDRSGPAVLQSIEDMGFFIGSSGTFKEIVDLEKDTALPHQLLGSRTLFIAVGRVDAGVDLRSLPPSAVTVDKDRNAVTIRLPSPVLTPVRLDIDQSYVYDRKQGVFDDIAGLFGGADPNETKQVYQVGERHIDEAAQNAGLRIRAAQNLRAVLQGMLRPLGFGRITVIFTG